MSRQRIRRAVDRNRIRRLVRESFRHHASSLPSVDLVVMAGRAATEAANSELTTHLDRLWMRVQKAGSASDSERPSA